MMNRRAFNRINYGMFLATAQGENGPQGCVVNSLHQVTSSMPFKFSMTVNKSNETFRAIEHSGFFAATVLSKDAPKELVDLFGYKSGRAVNKFEGKEVQSDLNGSPYLTEGAIARFSFKVVDKLDLSTYMLYIADAVDAEVLADGAALTVDDFKNAGSTAPATATVIRTLDKNFGWKCSVCGYIAEMEELPQGYQCPICRANRDKFVKL